MSNSTKAINTTPQKPIEARVHDAVPEGPVVATLSRRISLDAYGATKLPKIETPSELDEFGLPVRKRSSRSSSVASLYDKSNDGASEEQRTEGRGWTAAFRRRSRSSQGGHQRSSSLTRSTHDDIHEEAESKEDEAVRGRPLAQNEQSKSVQRVTSARSRSVADVRKPESRPGSRARSRTSVEDSRGTDVPSEDKRRSRSDTMTKIMEAGPGAVGGGISEWSHQVLAPRKEEVIEEKEEEWQDMPALGKYDYYDDEGHLVAKGHKEESDDDLDRGGAGKGYTRVQIDDDAKSATSMDENTSYLFKEKGTNVVDEDEDLRDPLAQMQATKDLLTEGQRIAYVGVARLGMIQMLRELEKVPTHKALKKHASDSVEGTKMWSQKMMVRLYGHMDIDAAEQIMIEQLAEHGVITADLTPALMKNSRVKNPMAEVDEALKSPGQMSTLSKRSSRSSYATAEEPGTPVADYEKEPLTEVMSPTQLPATKNIDIDLRWTVLCDLFLVLIADSIYDSRSRVLLETVGKALDVEWVDICRFEKRVTDALEMQEQASKENWDEAEHMEARRKQALKRKYMMMGLATVGGSLIIGLSAGLLAPVIGAGLAAGFTTIGVAGTSGFLAGVGGTALITTIGVTTGGGIAVKASNRRMGAVKTFEYRPLHNNKRVNLILTIAGWMNGKVDDVRLPFSTVDPLMGDIYSLHWEPDMLQSIGDTIRILATEALTQGLQQVLAATILTALMASLTLPIWLLKLSYLLDNPWSVSMDRADAAGLILADSLVDRNLGARPITLVGFSLGARLIFSCLKELANKGAYGLIQNVYLFGSPVVANKDEYLKARTVIAGRFVNGYATNDWILGYLFRATKGGISRVAGLAALEDVPGLENLDVTSIVAGHMAYRTAMPRLLRHVGWEVESDEFAEIIDPDPENHEGRQRELIREIEDARKEAQAKPEKRRFGFFKRGRLAEKRNWETYDEKTGDSGDKDDAAAEANGRRESRVLFDIEAIKRELESESVEVRQLETTMPALKLDLSPRKSSPEGQTTSIDGIAKQPERSKTDKIPQGPFREPLKTSKSFDGTSRPPQAGPNDISPTSHADTHAPETNNVSKQDSLRNSFATSPPVPANSNKQPTPQPTPPPPSSTPPWQDPSRHAAPRPDLRAMQTMPPIDHNAWADEDEDETWGKERDVVMSFE